MPDVQETTHVVRNYNILDPRTRSGQDVVVETCPRRVRVVFNAQTIADSTRMKLVHEKGCLPVYYFPRDDVRMNLMTRTGRATHSSTKGDASHWTISVGGREAAHAMWSFETPLVPELAGLVAFQWEELDHWYEEDEEVFVHARDPYKRIDTVLSSRRVEVRLGGQIVADTQRAHFLFETGLPTRYYIEREDIIGHLLGPTTLETVCPYKGTARYFSLNVAGKLFDNIIWTYPDPIPECPRIRNLLCFFNERVDAIMVEGREIPKQRTPWSLDQAPGND
jgi:uncharacterized protein (DUF427 family)